MGGSERGIVRFGCPACGARLKSLREQAGGKLRCPECSEVVRVPAPEVVEASQRSAPEDDVWIASHVTIDAGNGSGNAVNRVASGTYDMGFADMAALIEHARASGARVCRWPATWRSGPSR